MVVGKDEARGVAVCQPPAETAERNTWIWPSMSCAVVLACILIANPFTKAGFCDDWSYAHVAMKLAETGHMQYNEWGNPLILFQCLWALPWIRLFGFSLPVLGASMVPLTLAFVLMVYATGREIGLRPVTSGFAAITMGTSPLFLILAASFMTDVCGCLFSLICVYATLKSAHAESGSIASRWLWILALAGLVGGANRQIVWVAPLSLIPYLFWIRRRDSQFRVHAAAAYLISIGAIVLLLHDFGQPFSPMMMTDEQKAWVLRHHAAGAARLIVQFLMMAIMLSGPAFCCLVPLLRRKRPLWVVGSVVAVFMIAIAQIVSGYPSAPYGNHILSPTGPLGASAAPPLSSPVRVALTFAVDFCILMLLVNARGALSWGALCSDRTAHVFAIFSCGYLFLLLPGAFTGFCFDRHILPMLPLVILEVLRRISRFARTVPVFAWAVAVVFAGYGVVLTHDYFSGMRARIAAAEALQRTGVPRNHISAGFEYDGWTQVSRTGRVRVGAYIDHMTSYADRGYWIDFWSHSPGFEPEFVILNDDPGTPVGAGIFKTPFQTWTAPHEVAVVVWRRSDLTNLLVAAQTMRKSVWWP
jgi:hypothetical protein